MDLAELLPIAIKASITLMVVSLGLEASASDATFLFRHPGLLLRSLLSMNVLMPLVAAGFAVAFDMPDTVEVALVALAISPVPPILPKKELEAGGSRPYALGLLVAVGLCSIVVVPVAVSLLSGAFNRAGNISPATVAKLVLLSIIVPLAVGLLFRRLFPAAAAKIARPLGVVGTVLLVASCIPLLIASWPAMHALFGNGTVALVAAVAAIGLAIGHLLGGPVSDDRTVLALSTSSRHPAIALAIAVSGGGDSKPMLAGILLYLIVATIIAVPYLMWRKRRHAAEAGVVAGPSK